MHDQAGTLQWLWALVWFLFGGSCGLLIGGWARRAKEHDRVERLCRTAEEAARR